MFVRAWRGTFSRKGWRKGKGLIWLVGKLWGSLWIEGRLELGNLRLCNKALLAKWLWRFALELESLWHRIMESKHGTHPFDWVAKGVKDTLKFLLLDECIFWVGRRGIWVWSPNPSEGFFCKSFIRLLLDPSLVVVSWSLMWFGGLGFQRKSSSLLGKSWLVG